MIGAARRAGRSEEIGDGGGRMRGDTAVQPSRRDTFDRERPDPAGVTEEHLRGPQNASFAVGRSPTSPLYLFSVRGGGVLCLDLVDMQGLIGCGGVS